METVVRAKKVGGSVMVRLPKEIVEHESIIPGELVRVEVRKVRKDWFGTLRGLKPLKKEEKLQMHDDIRD